MNPVIQRLRKLLSDRLPQSRIHIDEPENPNGSYWVDVTCGRKRQTIEYRPKNGFGVFHDKAGFGEGPAEIYRSPELAAQRVAQMVRSTHSQPQGLELKEIRELYGKSQVALAKKAGVKQPAISRFEKRGEVKLSTLAAAIKALGGELEVRARFKDADVPISLSKG